MDVVAHNQNRPTFRRSAFSWVGVSGCMPVKGDGDAVDLSALIVAIALHGHASRDADPAEGRAPKGRSVLIVGHNIHAPYTELSAIRFT